MHTKSDTKTHIQNFIAYCQNQFFVQMKNIRSDNGSEFIIPSYYASLGILHQRS